MGRFLAALKGGGERTKANQPPHLAAALAKSVCRRSRLLPSCGSFTSRKVGDTAVISRTAPSVLAPRSAPSPHNRGQGHITGPG